MRVAGIAKSSALYELYTDPVQYTVVGAIPKLKVDLSSPIPAVRQIADNLRVLLVNGQLGPGARLPSVRRVALELNVHFNTVAEAYRELAAEGWLDLKHGRGAQVVEREVRSATRSQIIDFRQRLRQLAARMQASGVPPKRIADELRELAEGYSK